jgi:hypothetical protein
VRWEIYSTSWWGRWFIALLWHHWNCEDHESPSNKTEREDERWVCLSWGYQNIVSLQNGDNMGKYGKIWENMGKWCSKQWEFSVAKLLLLPFSLFGVKNQTWRPNLCILIGGCVTHQIWAIEHPHPKCCWKWKRLQPVKSLLGMELRSTTFSR